MIRRNAFTLLELLVTISIIGMMVAFMIPAYSKYGKNNLFKQFNIEAKSMIGQMNIMAKNPEQSKTRYLVKLATTAPQEVQFYRDNDDNNNLIKSLKVPSDYTLSLKSGVPPTDVYLVCDSTGDFCCQVAAANGVCTTPLNGEFFHLSKGTKTNETAFIKVFPNPFRIEVEYQ